MRLKYKTHGVILARTPLGEASAFITIITSELGLVRARAQSIRRPGAKLAPALATFAESSLVLVRGAESWRVAGAVLEENWSVRMCRMPSRIRATRIAGLVLRLVAGEAHILGIFPVIHSFFEALATVPEEMQEAAEILAALRILAALGLDAGEIPGSRIGTSEGTLESAFAPSVLDKIRKNRTGYIARINNGIVASGL